MKLPLRVSLRGSYGIEHAEVYVTVTQMAVILALQVDGLYRLLRG